MDNHIEDTVTYFFVDEDGTEACSNHKPIKFDGIWIMEKDEFNMVELPPNTIYSCFGIKLTYDSEPIIVMHK